MQNFFPRISLAITLEYSNTDNWSRLKPFISSLGPNHDIKFTLEFSPDSIQNFYFDIDKNLEGINSPTNVDIIESIASSISSFQMKITTDAGDKLKKEDVLNLLRCHFIDAQRGVDDSNAIRGSKLSKVFQKHFNLRNQSEANLSDDLKEAIGSANIDIDGKLKDFFKNFIESFSFFGFPGMQDQNLELRSDLDVEAMLKNNVKLYYTHESKFLSEKYNGLGYSNLIYIISEVLSYKILNEKESRDLTLIFIEEPEAHMHPQMQDVFISQINRFIKEKGFNVQLIVSTHSSHIISKSEFSSIRYFSKKNQQTKIKDLLDFDKINEKSENIAFLKQYLTLGKCDLFFADKVILFEGTVERLLLPVFINKMSSELGPKCLKTQYVASVEIGGAYMDKFKELLLFLDVKSLLITDLDAVMESQSSGEKPRTVYTKCEVKNEEKILTSNSTLKNWLPRKNKITDLLSAVEGDKISNNVRVSYQTNYTKDQTKCGRSFEEAFVIENHSYIFSNRNSLNSISNFLSDLKNADEVLKSSYEIQEHIDKNSKKTNFAFDLILTKQDDWNVPSYIKEGLNWLAQ